MKTNTHSGLGDIHDVGNLGVAPWTLPPEEWGGEGEQWADKSEEKNNKMSGANPYQMTGRTGVEDGERQPRRDEART